MRLVEAQADFLDDLLGIAERTPEGRRRAFRNPPAGTIEDRWAIYANAFVVRIAESLANDYPAVARILGESAFRSLAARYLRACPPCSYDIGRCGDRLAGFLATDALSEALPFLPDLAAFEWMLAEAIGVEDVTSLRWEDLVVLGPDAVADARLEPVPGAAVLRSRWPLPDLWRAKDLEGIDIELEGRPATVAVWRVGVEPRWRTCTPDEATVIEGAASGATLARLLDDGSFDAERAVTALRSLVRDGFFRQMPHSEAAVAASLSQENER